MFCPKPGKPKRNGYINNTKNTYYDLDNKVKISLKKGNKKIMSNILPECKKMQRINEKGEIDLIVYAKGVVNKYKKEILEARRKLGYGSKQLIFDDGPISAADIDNIDQLATKKGRSKLFWYGIIYQITEIDEFQIKGESYGGMTTLTLFDRWHFAVRDAITKPETWHFPLIRAIRNYLFNELGLDIEDLKINGKFDWKKIHVILYKRFQRKVKRICFNDNSLRIEERKFIRDNNLIEDGLNILGGGEGGPAIDLPMLSVAKLIALGFTITDIHDSIVNKHQIQCSLQTVRQRIIDYWESFKNSQIMFLRPVLENLIKARFELYEINQVFGRFMLERIKLFFGGLSYRQLLKIIDPDWSCLSISDKFPSWTNQGRITAIIPIETLKYLVRRYLYANEAIRDKKVQIILSEYSSSDVKRQNLVYQVQQQLDYNNWEEAREAITIPLVLKKLREGKNSPKKIYRFIGYNESSAHTHNTLSRELFLGLNTNELRDFLIRYPNVQTFEDFKKINLLEKEKIIKCINKDFVDNLLFKYVRSDEAAKELEGFYSGDFLKELKKYYPNYKKAKWIVKAPFIIENLRNLPKDYNSRDVEQIFRDIGYSKNSAEDYSRIIQDMFFGMGIKESIFFFTNHPKINTYEEALNAYKNEHRLDILKPHRSKYYQN
jgi:hypothetical protein